MAVGRDGRFTFTLAPGRYTVVGHSAMYLIDGRQGVCLPLHPMVTVEARHAAHVDVFCQEK